MKFKLVTGAVALVLLAEVTLAQEPGKQGQMSAEQKAAMEAMMKAGTPGDAHKKLASMVGTWDTKVMMWMDPAAPPQVSKGTSTNKWVLGKRWVRQDFSGSFMGKPFTGVGYTGYDNVKEQYVGTWMDSASTSVMVSNGKAEDDGKTYTFSSTMDDPMTKKPVDLKTKVTVVDNNKHVMEMWGPAPDGKQYKMMEITYTRKK
jgi:hypothetical protein